MKRDIPALWGKPFDVVVVGAGVYGACIALELSESGYRVALIEKNDFGAGTSANSLGILHGGLRYLQHFNLKRMRRSIRSRHFFMQIAPHLIDVVPFKLPLKGWGIKSPLAMRIALALNDLISHARNQGLAENLCIPNGRVARPRADEQGWFSEIKGFNGIGIWSEAVVAHTEGLILQIVKHAYHSGAQVANYCSAEQLQFDNNQLTGLMVRDLIKGKTGLIQTRWVIDAAGHSAGNLRDDNAGQKPQNWARAVNAVVKGRIIGNAAIALSVRDQLKDSHNLAQKGERMLFFVPRKQHTLIGTFYHQAQTIPAGLKLSQTEKTQFIETINRCHPNLKLKIDDILYWHSGWLPTTGHNDQLELEKKSALKLKVYDHISGVLDVHGVKFTTAPEVAKDVRRLLSAQLPIPERKAANPGHKHSAHSSEFEDALYARYGKDSAAVQNFLNQNPAYKRRIHPDLLLGEVYYVCEHQMVQHLSDIMLQRFSFEIDQSSLHLLAEEVSHLVQDKLAWSDKRRRQELQDTLKLIDQRCQT